MTKLSFLICKLIVIVLAVTAVVFTGNSLWIYVDIASLILGIIVPLIVISFIYGPSEQMALCREVLKKGDHPDKVLLTRSLAYFKTMKKLLIYSAVIWTIMGAIGISVNLESPEALGANFGVLMIVPLYVSLFLFMIVEPLRASAEKKLS